MSQNGQKSTAASSVAHFVALFKSFWPISMDFCASEGLPKVPPKSLGNQFLARYSGATVPVKLGMQASHALKERPANRNTPHNRNGPF